jgi:hypothetical protein
VDELHTDAAQSADLLDDMPNEHGASEFDASLDDDPAIDTPLPALRGADELQLRAWLAQIVRQDENALADLYHSTVGRVLVWRCVSCATPLPPKGCRRHVLAGLAGPAL